jgi:hypothetical protein
MQPNSEFVCLTCNAEVSDVTKRWRGLRQVRLCPNGHPVTVVERPVFAFIKGFWTVGGLLVLAGALIGEVTSRHTAMLLTVLLLMFTLAGAAVVLIAGIRLEKRPPPARRVAKGARCGAAGALTAWSLGVLFVILQGMAKRQ